MTFLFSDTIATSGAAHDTSSVINGPIVFLRSRLLNEMQHDFSGHVILLMLALTLSLMQPLGLRVFKLPLK